MYKDQIIAVDTSLYQRRISGWELRQGGVDLVILKADEMFTRNAREALDYELLIAAYIWSDPSESAQITFDRSMKILDGWPLTFVAVDMEQWWAKWGQWYQAILNKLKWILVQRAKPEKIQGHALNLANLLKQLYPTIIYSSKGFCQSYVPKVAGWICDWDVWAAHYGRQPAKSVICEWADVYKSWMPNYPVLTPAGTKSLVGHQFTGDRFKLPGTYSDDKGKKRSPVDISVFNADWIQKQVNRRLNLA